MLFAILTLVLKESNTLYFSCVDTIGGFGTNDEMCLTYFITYPRLDQNGNCWSITVSVHFVCRRCYRSDPGLVIPCLDHKQAPPQKKNVCFVPVTLYCFQAMYIPSFLRRGVCILCLAVLGPGHDGFNIYTKLHVFSALLEIDDGQGLSQLDPECENRIVCSYTCHHVFSLLYKVRCIVVVSVFFLLFLRIFWILVTE